MEMFAAAPGKSNLGFRRARMVIDAVARGGKIAAMKIHLNRGGQSLGQFTPDEIRAGYTEGKFTGTDLAWRDGMATWRPLSEVIDELAPPAGSAETPPLPVVASGSLPWEKRAETGFWTSLFETIRMVLLEPKAAFATMKQTGGLGAPLFFFVLVASVGGAAGIVYQMVLNSVQPAATPQEQAAMAIFTSTAAVGATLMFLPIMFAALAFVSAALVHLSLMLVGGARRPFEATFRVTCYAGGATAVLQLLPVCGAFISSIWNFVCMVFGLSEVHGIGKGRAALAVLLPTIVCCGLLIGAVFAVIASFGSLEEFLKAANAIQG